MLRIILAAAAAALALAGTAGAVPVGEKNNGLSICDEQYLNLYAEAADLGWPLGKNVVKAGQDNACGQLPKLEAAIAAITTAASTVEQTATGGGAGGDLASIRACESGGAYTASTGNGFGGAYQFDQATWEAAGGTGSPATASPGEQDAVAAGWIASGHRTAWPNC